MQQAKHDDIEPAAKWQRQRGPSLQQQWFLATLLSMLPLIVAVSYALWQLNEQSHSQSRQLRDQTLLGQLSVTLRKQTEDIERAARQYQLLREDRFLTLLHQKHDKTLESLLAISLLLPLQDKTTYTETSKSLKQHLAQIIQLSESGHAPTSLDEHYRHAQQDNQKIRQTIAEAVDASLHRNRDKLDTARRHILLTSALALPATLLLLGFSSLLISRSLGKLSKAIQQLGRGQWRPAIAIEGPADLVRLGERLEWMRAELENAEQQQERLSRHITHELKSPLAAIIDANELLSEQLPGPVTREQQRVLSIQRSQANHLQELIQQLLNYNAAASVNHTPEEELDLAAVCQRLFDTYRSRYFGNAPHCTVDSGFDQIRCHPLAIEMILSNLISNALQYCDSSDTVTVRWWKTEHFWFLTVKDSGPGIPEEEQQRVFQAFEQGTVPRRGALKGSGLGLAIVKDCADSLGAQITLNSERDKGCEFTLRFSQLSQRVTD
ncbi:HAMP domain-containing histidine kinase [Spongiibacter sp. KMU-166]|uniref:histidine kinase n=1 Tax=Spongiibacter thalassae TaxID=2721624 RepID=A0ABX1GDW1_9GAMM|nr:HAMP domain-containing sensor histidine kinase [Spongiibacter thalassae]NKI17130.1 HAMP domain-containing histidine kinase [Spongiibacter thalassae]